MKTPPPAADRLVDAWAPSPGLSVVEQKNWARITQPGASIFDIYQSLRTAYLLQLFKEDKTELQLRILRAHYSAMHELNTVSPFTSSESFYWDFIWLDEPALLRTITTADPITQVTSADVEMIVDILAAGPLPSSAIKTIWQNRGNTGDVYTALNTAVLKNYVSSVPRTRPVRYAITNKLKSDA